MGPKARSQLSQEISRERLSFAKIRGATLTWKLCVMPRDKRAVAALIDEQRSFQRHGFAAADTYSDAHGRSPQLTFAMMSLISRLARVSTSQTTSAIPKAVFTESTSAIFKGIITFGSGGHSIIPCASSSKHPSTASCFSNTANSAGSGGFE